MRIVVDNLTQYVLIDRIQWYCNGFSHKETSFLVPIYWSTMGPPKAKPKRISLDEIRRRYDCFEYRWNADSQGYYMFNPWTGETIFDTNLELLDRSKSMWAVPDRFPSEIAQTVMLYPQFYSSRRWGRRRFNGWESVTMAATHIAAVARGYIARKALRKYYRTRYHTQLDNFSGYYFFVDHMSPEEDTKWYKPLLAFPDDILPYVEEDTEDYMKGKKYSRQDFTLGPMYKVAGLNKADLARSDLAAFVVPNEWREQAVGSYSEIDLNCAPIGAVVAWMEGTKASKLKVSQFNAVRVALTKDGWPGVLAIMDEHPHDIVLQMYGYHSFSKSFVPVDDAGILSFAANDAMEKCVEVIKDDTRSHSPLLKLFALEAMFNILSVRPGRAEYLNASLVPEQGELRHAALEIFFEKKFSIFLTYLRVIANETISVYSKGQNKPEAVKKPLARSVELVDANVKCLSVLAQEIETKEQLALLVVQPLLFALDTCQEEANVMLNGLKLMYNLCYRCESGQEAILAYVSPQVFFGKVRHHHSGDADVMRQCRRLELALLPFGWRGNVELIITKEMHDETVDPEYFLESQQSARYK